MKRETGYYWVKINGKWTIGFWLVYDDGIGDCWNIGRRVTFDKFLDEINEIRILNPDESKPLTIGPEECTNRCCGRCDGVNDICVADMVCELHDVIGCEICYGKRSNSIKT